MIALPLRRIEVHCTSHHITTKQQNKIQARVAPHAKIFPSLILILSFSFSLWLARSLRLATGFPAIFAN